MRLLAILLIASLLPLRAVAESDPEMSARIRASVLKVKAMLPDGGASFGSAVLVAPGRLVTNCHVTRHAKRIEVSNARGTWRVESQDFDIGRDLCFLSVPGVAADIAVRGDTADLRPDDGVIAVGYPGGDELTVCEGRVTGLYRYEGGRVVQSSAPFDFGASGGGLFDRHGRLVGILAFKSPAGGAFHFALPVEWLGTSAAAEAGSGYGAAGQPALAFWQRPRDERPYFLRAAALEARGDWVALAALGEHWLQSEGSGPEPLNAIAKASRHLPRGPGAAAEGSGQ